MNSALVILMACAMAAVGGAEAIPNEAQGFDEYAYSVIQTFEQTAKSETDAFDSASETGVEYIEVGQNGEIRVREEKSAKRTKKDELEARVKKENDGQNESDEGKSKAAKREKAPVLRDEGSTFPMQDREKKPIARCNRGACFINITVYENCEIEHEHTPQPYPLMMLEEK